MFAGFYCARGEWRTRDGQYANQLTLPIFILLYVCWMAGVGTFVAALAVFSFSLFLSGSRSHISVMQELNFSKCLIQCKIQLDATIYVSFVYAFKLLICCATNSSVSLGAPKKSIVCVVCVKLWRMPNACIACIRKWIFGGDRVHKYLSDNKSEWKKKFKKNCVKQPLSVCARLWKRPNIHIFFAPIWSGHFLHILYLFIHAFFFRRSVIGWVATKTNTPTRMSNANVH